MKIRELSVPDAFEVDPVQHGDDRGVFLEWFARRAASSRRRATVSPLAQANCSVSSAGRGARHPLRRRAPRTGQVRHLRRGRGARRGGRPARRLTDVRRAGTPSGLDDVDRRAVLRRRGARARLHGADRRRSFVYLCSERLQPPSGARRPPVRPRPRHRLAGRRRAASCRPRTRPHRRCAEARSAGAAAVLRTHCPLHATAESASTASTPVSGDDLEAAASCGLSIGDLQERRCPLTVPELAASTRRMVQPSGGTTVVRSRNAVDSVLR